MDDNVYNLEPVEPTQQPAQHITITFKNSDGVTTDRSAVGYLVHMVGMVGVSSQPTGAGLEGVQFLVNHGEIILIDFEEVSSVN